MEQPSKKDNTKKDSAVSPEKQKDNLGKTSFWSRLCNFTVETPKKVVMEGDTIKLVPITPETEAVVEDKTKEAVSVMPEAIVTREKVREQAVTPKKIVEDSAGVKPPEVKSKPVPVIEDKTKKPVSVKPETAVAREIVKEQARTPQKVIDKNAVTKVQPSAPKTLSVIEDKTNKPVTTKPGAVIENKIEMPVSASVPPKTIAVEVGVERQTLPSTEKLKKGLEKTRVRFWSRLANFLSFKRGINEAILEELEDILIGADIGVKPVQRLIREIQEAWKSKIITETSQIHDFIKNKLKEDLQSLQTDIRYAVASPTVIMVVGVNGVGKTTAIAKLANYLIKDGKKVMVAAGDTFRAAATDQLEIWSKRIGAEIVKHQTGSDPAAVAYDALEASISRGIDVLIVDTAGRLHTHENLMNELSKIKRVISKKIPDAPHEVLLVLDATTGQNAISQAKMFKQAVNVTGIFLAKLDGTAKGGIVLGMRSEINIPVKFIGLGETANDIEKFNTDAFVNALFE